MNLIFPTVIAHEYNNVLFHVMDHKVQKDEAYMQATMEDYTENHSEGIKIIASDFLKCKGLFGFY